MDKVDVAILCIAGGLLVGTTCALVLVVDWIYQKRKKGNER